MGDNVLSKEDKERLRETVITIADSLTRIAAEREVINGFAKDVSEELNIDKKLIRRLAKLYYNTNFKEFLEEAENLESTYRGLFPQHT